MKFSNLPVDSPQHPPDAPSGESRAFQLESPKDRLAATDATPAHAESSEASSIEQFPQSDSQSAESVVAADDLLWQQLARDLEYNPARKTIPLLEQEVPGEQEPVADLLGRTMGKFRLEEVIARGGMGIILRSRDLELDREVAVKLLLKRHLGKRPLQQQFTNEVRITSRLQHPGIIPIYETGVTADRRPYFAMKLVRGQTLEELLLSRDSRQNPLPRLLKIFEQVCQTLSYTHVHGIIHLDIKPANIMVGAFGEVHLMDWGLARAADLPCGADQMQGQDSPSVPVMRDHPETQVRYPIASDDLSKEVPEGTVWGTPAYMSAEQAQGGMMDARSDVFGLGAILCEILTGSPPYQGTTLLEVCSRAAQAELSGAMDRLQNCGADAALVRLAMTCLQGEPSDRPANASAVAREITLHQEALLQRAESDLEQFFELSLDLFCIAGLDGYFRRVNSNFPRVLGYTEKELISRPFMDFVHPDDRAETIDVMSRLQHGQPVVQFQNRYLTSNNEWQCFEWTAKSIPTDGVIFAVARDVSHKLHGGSSNASRR